MGKYTIEFNDDAEKLLARLAEKQGVPKAQIVRRALALLDYVEKESEVDGQRIGVADSDGKLVREIVI